MPAFRIRRAIGAIAIAWCFTGAAPAATGDARDPLDLPIRSYGLVLGTALLGGLVNWLTKVRRGDVAPWSLHQFMGELCTSAFAGLLCFWLCQWANFSPLLTAALVGVAGHMGTRAITAFEVFAEKKWGALTGEPK